MLTTKQKQAIRNHWKTFNLRFHRDLSVSAQKQKGGAFGILYTSQQTKMHLAAIGMPVNPLQCCE